jgi:imidazolonepropionase-like amidohydrolase
MKNEKPILISNFISICLAVLVTNGYAQSLGIKAGSIIDPLAGKVINHQIMVVKNGKIDQIGIDIGLDSVDQIIDLSNSWVMAGMMDCHVHITSNLPYRKGIWNQVYIEESTAFRALRGLHNAELLLNAGFTTIKDIGNDANYATADVIRAIRMGWNPGPTIIYSGKIIAPYAGQVHGVSPENEHFWQYEYIDADTPDEIRKAVRKNIYFGATTIKLVADQFAYYYDQQDIEAAVHEANKSGLKVAVHVMGGEAAKNVILGGAAAIEHGMELDNDMLRLMKEKGTFLVGTDLHFQNWYAYGMDSTYAQKLTDQIVDRLKRAYEHEVKMAYGTDVVIDIEGMNRVESNYEVLNSWKEADIPPMFILKCMTTNAAELMGIDKNRGQLKKDYWADIVAFNKNPLDDIDNIRTVHFVMKEGKIIRNEE